MKHFSLGLFTLFVTTSSFANSVNCYIDKEMRYANGRPGNDIIVEMHIGRDTNSVRFFEGGKSLIPSVQHEEENNSTTVLIGEALNWQNTAEYPRDVQEMISLDVSGLLSSGKGNRSSESVVLSNGTRIHLRCEGKSE
jgi:hypothetical protein